MGRKIDVKILALNIQMANTHRNRCSALLIIREMQLKTSMRYHLPPSEWPSSKNLQTIMLERVWRKQNPLALGRNVN